MNTFLVDFSIVIAIAAVVVLVFNHFKLPQSIGYILAGLIIGPHVPPNLITDEENIKMLSDMGVLFLMFAIGLGFSFRELRRVGMAVLIPAVLDVVILTWAGYMAGQFLGWNKIESLILGFIICDTSTTILAKTLEDAGLAREHFARTLFTITLLEDIIAILIIAMLGGLASGGASMPWAPVLNRLGILVVFLAAVITAGLLFVPRMLARIARHRNDEVLLMTVLGLCFGIALLADKLGLSIALGAFLMGAIIAEARPINRIEELVSPLRQLFSSIFFIAMGLMIAPREIWDNLGAVLLVTAVMAVCKVVGGTALCLLIGEKPRDALRIGLGLAQVAEFAFIIAVTAGALKITERPVFQIAVGVAVLSTLLNPFLMRLAPPISRGVHRTFGPRFAEGLDAYSGWIHRILSPQADRAAFTKARRDFFFLALHLTLIAAIFLVAGYVKSVHLLDAWLRSHGLATPSGGSPVLWFAAALAASPLYAAALHKLGHLARDLSNSFVSAPATPWVQTFQVLLQHVFLLLGVVAMAVGTFLFSSSLLPDWKFQLVLMCVLALVIAFRWKRLTRAHASAQATLRGLFERESPRDEIRNVLNVHMRPVPLRAGFPAAGQTIATLNIRARTGASVISIRRGENHNVNPTLNEPFRPGDNVLLLGSDAELNAAETLLTGRPPAGEN